MVFQIFEGYCVPVSPIQVYTSQMIRELIIVVIRLGKGKVVQTAELCYEAINVPKDAL